MPADRPKQIFGGIVATPHRKQTKPYMLYLSVGRCDSQTGKNMITTALVIFAVWVGLNAAFVALRLYVTSDRRRPPPSLDLRGFPNLREPSASRAIK
jgi:hypothetical protein